MSSYIAAELAAAAKTDELETLLKKSGAKKEGEQPKKLFPFL